MFKSILLNKRVIAVLTANLFLILCSYVTIPNPFIPITLQTFGVCVVGALLGPRMAFCVVVLWLVEALIGLPVLSEGKAGLSAFRGATAGYLFSFPVMAVIMGVVSNQRMLSVLLAALIAHLVCLSMGSVWLSLFLKSTLMHGFNVGFFPFIVAGLVKVVLIACAVKMAKSIGVSIENRAV